jgi:hypothetical protein
VYVSLRPIYITVEKRCHGMTLVRVGWWVQSRVGCSCGRVLDAIKMYESHPSILRIRENVSVCVEFSFSPVSLEDIRTELEALDIRKDSND